MARAWTHESIFELPWKASPELLAQYWSLLVEFGAVLIGIPVLIRQMRLLANVLAMNAGIDSFSLVSLLWVVGNSLIPEILRRHKQNAGIEALLLPEPIAGAVQADRFEQIQRSKRRVQSHS